MIKPVNKLLYPDRKAISRKDLEKQLDNPDHCFIEVRPGELFSHNPDDEWVRMNGFAWKKVSSGKWLGRPVRFTRLAATRFVEELKLFHPASRIVNLY